LRNTRATGRTIAVLLGVAFIAAACGSSSKTSSPTTAAPTATTSGSGATTTAAPAATTTPPKTGGTITLGNEQEPDCLDWMGSCGGSSWGFWAVGVQTMPFPFDIVKDGDTWVYKASSLLTGEPTVVTSPKMVVTYKINPKAV